MGVPLPLQRARPGVLHVSADAPLGSTLLPDRDDALGVPRGASPAGTAVATGARAAAAVGTAVGQTAVKGVNAALRGLG